MKDNKRLYSFFQIWNTKKDYWMMVFFAYIKIIKPYGVSKPIHPRLVKAKLIHMGL